MRENPYGIQYTGRIVHIEGGERRHVFNNKTGGALCGAGLHRDGKVIAGAVATSTGKKVDCLRCIKILYVDHAQRYLVERSLRPSAPGKRYKHAMIAGGRQGFAIGRKQTKNSTPELPYGPSSVEDFRRGSNEHPTQTRLASKRQRATGRVRIITPAQARVAVGGGLPVPMPPAPRSRAAAAPAEPYSSDRFMNNPKHVMKLADWQKAMSRAESKGDIRTMRALEKALAVGAVKTTSPKSSKKVARHNPAEEHSSDRAMSNPKHVMKFADWQKAMSRAESKGDVRTMRALEKALAVGAVKTTSPKSSKKVARRNPGVEQNKENAAEAMRLFRSGEADSLKAAWAMVR